MSGLDELVSVLQQTLSPDQVTDDKLSIDPNFNMLRQD